MIPRLKSGYNRCLPSPGIDPKRSGDRTGRTVGSCGDRFRELQIPLQHIHPQVSIAHRIIGNVAVAYREIIDFECIAIFEGRGDFHVGAEHYEYGPGQLLIIPPCQAHTLMTRSGVRGDHIAIHFDLLP